MTETRTHAEHEHPAYSDFFFHQFDTTDSRLKGKKKKQREKEEGCLYVIKMSRLNKGLFLKNLIFRKRIAKEKNSQLKS